MYIKVKEKQYLNATAFRYNPPFLLAIVTAKRRQSFLIYVHPRLLKQQTFRIICDQIEPQT